MGHRVSRRAPYGVIVVVAALLTLVTGSGLSNAVGAAGPQEATTFGRLADAALDTAPLDEGTGAVVHPVVPQTVHARPGGPPIAVLPTEQLGNPTWVPVVETAPGWLKVLLPTRPNGATGWISGSGDGLRVARTPYLIKVERSARRLTVIRSGEVLGSWPVAVGAPETPTPLGRTFLLASLAPVGSAPGSLILPTGAHSATLDSYGGGPGTVAFHGWHDASVFGEAVSHGCVRVPDEALAVLSRVPLGTLVIVTR